MFVQINHRHPGVDSLLTKLVLLVSVLALSSTLAVADTTNPDELHERANALLRSGQYKEAIPIAQAAMELRIGDLGKESNRTLSTMELLAHLYRVTGNLPNARKLFETVLQTREKMLGSQHLDTIRAVNNLANLHFITGTYALAESMYQRALLALEETVGRDHESTAYPLNNLGEVYRVTGAYHKARPYYLRALEIREKRLGSEHQDTAATLSNLGILYSSLGDYVKSESYYQRALAIRTKVLGAAHPITANTLNNLANLYSTTGAYSKAEPLYRQALKIRETSQGSDHPETSAVISNLASLQKAIGDFTNAEQLFARALEIDEKVLGADHPGTANSLNNLAELYMARGELAKAEPIYLRVLSQRRKILGSRHPESIVTMNSLANLFRDTSRTEMAEPLYKEAQALALSSLGPDHPYTMRVMNDLALLNWQRGNESNALLHFRRAQSAQSRNSERFLLSGSEFRKEAYLKSLANNSFQLVSFSLVNTNNDKAELGLISVLQQKGRVLDAMTDSMRQLRQNLNKEIEGLFYQLAQISGQFSLLTFRGPGDLKPDEYRQQLISLSKRQELLESELAKQSLDFHRQQASISIERLKKSIPADAALVEWFRYLKSNPDTNVRTKIAQQARYAVYVLRRSGDAFAVDLGAAESIDGAIRQFRSAVSDPQSTNVKSSSAALYNRILKPIEKHLGDRKHLLLSPDGELNLVPMNALVDDSGRYLIHRYEISYLTSGRDLVQTSRSVTSNVDPIVIADPVFGPVALQMESTDSPFALQRSIEMDRSGFLFRPLKGTAVEARAIQGILKIDDSRVFLQERASEANIKSLRRPRIMHIASHGFFLASQDSTPTINDGQVPENPLLRAGLALSGANARLSESNEDGILTALELSQLDLLGTELVVLSACDGGIGDIQNGEGVYGLRRALVLAGAKTQVASLWKVSDDTTQRLMIDYYQGLLERKGRSASLRDAQLTMASIPTLAHPYYWASFIPIGNWKPLPATH